MVVGHVRIVAVSSFNRRSAQSGLSESPFLLRKVEDIYACVIIDFIDFIDFVDLVDFDKIDFVNKIDFIDKIDFKN
jgi:hypothetical protein